MVWDDYKNITDIIIINNSNLIVNHPSALALVLQIHYQIYQHNSPNR